MQKQIARVMEQEMSRSEFLIWLGIAISPLFGISHFYKAFSVLFAPRNQKLQANSKTYGSR